jgi:Fic family protein
MKTAIDQVKFMRSMFEFERLEQRVEHYFRNVRLDLRPESAQLYIAAVRTGEIERGEAPRLTGLKERTARDVLSILLRERFLVSDSPKGKLRAGFPVIALGTMFPNLYPSGDVDFTGPSHEIDSDEDGEENAPGL